ncbi:MAG: hypothetical protein K6G22_00780 [Lachnospiraceae bacterium]|nr:hypothetical protein [Lachnospiraceae bacterium]
MKYGAWNAAINLTPGILEADKGFRQEKYEELIANVKQNLTPWETRSYKYEYYPDLNAIAKDYGCTFFDAELGFIFDMDFDWIKCGDLKHRKSRERIEISPEAAFEIASRDDYCFSFFGEKSI